MRRVLPGVAILVVLSLGAGKGSTGTKIDHPDGALPTKIKTLGKSTRGQIVWLAYAGYRPHVLPDRASAQLTPATPIEFMQSFYYVDRRNEEGYHLLVTSEDGRTVKDYVGWVPGRYLVRDSSAVDDMDTGIVKKALIVNTRESLGTDLNEVAIRHAPDKGAKGKDEPYRLYTTLFVYGEADDYVLVGDKFGFSSREDKEAAKTVLGWLPKNRIAIWNTREAVEWDHEATLEPKDRPVRLNPPPPAKDAPRRRATPGRIYRDLDSAFAGRDGREKDAIFDEELETDETLGYPISRRMPHDAPRLPVLGRVRKHDPQNGKLFRVGGIGGLADASGKVILSGKASHSLQGVLDSLQSQLVQTDILFIVDDTESMDKSFPTVARAVRGITEMAKKSPDRKVRVAVSYYNDITKKSIELKREPIVASELKDAVRSGEEIAAEVAKHKVEHGGDTPEMVYRGIVEALDKAKFRSQARKMVIVLGDAGDISGSATRMKADPAYAKKYNIQAILDGLIPENLDREAAKEFYAIQVEDGDGDDAGGFRAQMTDLVKQYRERLRESTKKQLGDAFKEEAFRAPAGYFDSKHSQDRVIAELEKQYTRLLAESRRIKENLDRLKKGQWNNTKLSAEEERKINLELAKKGLKITIEDLKKSGGVQLFQEGYVWEKNKEGLSQIRPQIFINGEELKDLIDLLDQLESKGGKEITPRELVIGAIEKHANTRKRRGDAIDPERLQEFTLTDLAKLGTGVMFRSSILGRKLDELKEKEGAIQDGEYFELLHMRDLLKDANSDKEFRYKVRVETRKAGTTAKTYAREGEGTPVPRGFKLSTDTQVVWYYLDYRREWP